MQACKAGGTRMMRLVVLILGIFSLAACASTEVNPSTKDGVGISAQQQVVQSVPVGAEIGPNQRAVVLPPADVTVAKVSAFNGAYPTATTLAQEECIKQGRYAVRVSDLTHDGFVQFSCEALGKAF